MTMQEIRSDSEFCRFKPSNQNGLIRLLNLGFVGLAFLFLSCTNLSQTPSPRTEQIQQAANLKLPSYVLKRAKKARYALVLIHGITGDGRSSWTSPNGTYWPKLMEGDPAFKDFDIYVYEYPTSLFGECMAVSDLAGAMHTHLKSDAVFEDHESVIFLAHSMGGLIVRTFLLRYRDKADNVPMIIFMATPSAGSWKAKVGSLLPTCPQVEDLRKLDVNSFLKTQQSDWLNASFKDRIVSHCGIETQTSGGSLTVDRSSASLLCTGELLSIPTDHSHVVKPNSTDDLPHRFLKNVLSDLPTLHQRKLSVDDGADDKNPILEWGTSDPGTSSAYVVVNTQTLKKYSMDYRLIVLYRASDNFTEARDDTRVVKSEVFDITGERKTIRTRLGQDFMRQLIPSRFVQIYLLLLPNRITHNDIYSVNGALNQGAILVSTRGMQVSAVVQ